MKWIKAKYRRGIFIVAYSKTKEGIKYLVLERKLHWKGWEFPKGGLKKGEKILDALERELKEETGRLPLNTKKFDISGKYTYDKKYSDRPGIKGQSFSLFAAEIDFGKIELDKLEHSDYKWLDFENAVNKLTWPNQKKCLKVVNDFLKTKNMKFREFKLKSGKNIFLGKNSEQNEDLVKEFMKKENIILHTAKPGSPFCIINEHSPTSTEIKEAAVYCARYSQDWRDNKKDVLVHVFKGKDIYKTKVMKPGTFGVKKFKVIKAKKEEIEELEKFKRN